MPDGTMTRAPGRPMGLHQIGDMPCPKCGHPLYLTMGEGAALVTCTTKRKGKTCAQKAAVIAVRGAACLVFPISDDEFRVLSATDVTSTAVLGELGVLGATLVSAG